MKSGNDSGYEGVWITRKVYEDAERRFYEQLAKTTPAQIEENICSLTPLAGEVAKARQRLLETKDIYKVEAFEPPSPVDNEVVKFLEKKVLEFGKTLTSALERMEKMEARIQSMENTFLSGIHKTTQTSGVHEINISNMKEDTKAKDDDNDEDIDLFGSDSEDDDAAANKIREERLAAYNAKKAKKPALIAKSSIILDVKPWDDETDMKQMEAEVRKIETDGLLWGAAKLQPLAYGIHKLQITCVVEDEKVSVDWLQEQIEAISDYVQSVDIAAFNKI